MTDPHVPENPDEAVPRSDPPTMEELLAENERLRVRLALHEYFDAQDRLKKKASKKKRARSKR